MELDELKQAWRTLNQRSEQQYTLNLSIFRERKLDNARRRMRPLWWGQVIQISVGVILMLLFAPYWIAHIGTPHLMGYGLLMHAYGLVCVLTAARNLYLQSRLSIDATVLELQHRVAELRTWRLWEAVIHGVIWCFLWIPLGLIGFQLLGADLWVIAPSVVWAFIASAAVCVGIMVGLIRWSRMPGHERLRTTLEHSSIGRSVLATQTIVEEIARFEES